MLSEGVLVREMSEPVMKPHESHFQPTASQRQRA